MITLRKVRVSIPGANSADTTMADGSVAPLPCPGQAMAMGSPRSRRLGSAPYGFAARARNMHHGGGLYVSDHCFRWCPMHLELRNKLYDDSGVVHAVARPQLVTEHAVGI